MLTRIKDKIKRILFDIAFSCKIESLIINKKRGRAIIMYHGVDLIESKSFNQRHIESTILKNKYFGSRNIAMLFH